MIPGIAAAVMTAIFFAGGSPEFITIMLFVLLITYIVVQSKEIANLKDRIMFLAQATENGITELANATSQEMERMATDIGGEIHELAVFVANRTFGPHDDDDGEGVK